VDASAVGGGRGRTPVHRSGLDPVVLHLRLRSFRDWLAAFAGFLQLGKGLLYDLHLLISFLSIASTSLKLIKLAMNCVEMLQLCHNYPRLRLEITLIAAVLVSPSPEKHPHLPLNRADKAHTEFPYRSHGWFDSVRQRREKSLAGEEATPVALDFNSGANKDVEGIHEGFLD